MARLYRKEILQEPDAPAGFISLNEIKPAAPVQIEEQEEVTVGAE
jgi:hypothetical protein